MTGLTYWITFLKQLVCPEISLVQCSLWTFSCQFSRPRRHHLCVLCSCCTIQLLATQIFSGLSKARWLTVFVVISIASVPNLSHVFHAILYQWHSALKISSKKCMKAIREKNAKEALNAHALGHEQELDHPTWIYMVKSYLTKGYNQVMPWWPRW